MLNDLSMCSGPRAFEQWRPVLTTTVERIADEIRLYNNLKVFAL